MHLSGLLMILSLVHARPAELSGCWTAPLAVRIAGEAAARPRTASLIFSGRRDYADALLIKDGAREFVTDFDCAAEQPARCALLDDGGAFKFLRQGTSAQATFGPALAIDARESVRYARITNEGFTQNIRLTALRAAACVKE